MPPSPLRRLVAGVAAAGVVALTAATPAWATFPGADGRIAIGIFSQPPGCPFPRPACQFEGHLVSVEPDGSGRLAFGRDALTRPAWSPNGRQMAATDGYGDLSSSDPFSPPPTGKVFFGPAEGRLPFAARQRVAGPPVRFPVAESTDVSYTPGGRLLLVQDGRILVYRGGLLAPRVVFDTGDPSARRARMSPDGKTVAFVRGTDAAAEVWLVNADGTGLRELVDGAEPDWSPDGARLVVIDAGAQPRIVDVVSGVVTTPQLGPVDFAGTAVWSPSGDRLAFNVGYSVEVVDPVTGSSSTAYETVAEDGDYGGIVALAWQSKR